MNNQGKAPVAQNNRGQPNELRGSMGSVQPLSVEVKDQSQQNLLPGSSWSPVQHATAPGSSDYHFRVPVKVADGDYFPKSEKVSVTTEGYFARLLRVAQLGHYDLPWLLIDDHYLPLSDREIRRRIGNPDFYVFKKFLAMLERTGDLSTWTVTVDGRTHRYRWLERTYTLVTRRANNKLITRADVERILLARLNGSGGGWKTNQTSGVTQCIAGNAEPGLNSQLDSQLESQLTFPANKGTIQAVFVADGSAKKDQRPVIRRLEDIQQQQEGIVVDGNEMGEEKRQRDDAAEGVRLLTSVEVTEAAAKTLAGDCVALPDGLEKIGRVVSLARGKLNSGGWARKGLEEWLADIAKRGLNAKLRFQACQGCPGPPGDGRGCPNKWCLLSKLPGFVSMCNLTGNDGDGIRNALGVARIVGCETGRDGRRAVLLVPSECREDADALAKYGNDGGTQSYLNRECGNHIPIAVRVGQVERSW